MGRVVVVGSVNADVVVTVDHLPAPGETVAGGERQDAQGGKGANQAAAAARFGGAEVAFVGAVGDDTEGTAALGALTAVGVDVSEVAVTEGTRTGTALIVVDARGENQIALAPGANATLTPALVREALSRLRPGPGDVIVTVFELAPEIVVAVAEHARRVGATLLVTPAPAKPLPPGLVHARPVLLPNRGELARLTAGDDGEGGLGPEMVEAAATRLARQVAAPVVVTLGSDGALVADDVRRTLIPALPVASVVDTTGAGDALAGATAAALAAGEPLQTAVRLGVAAAGIAVGAAGARGALATRDEAQAALARSSDARAPGVAPTKHPRTASPGA